MFNGVLSVLEPYEVKVSSTVLRGERDSNVPCLPDNQKFLDKIGFSKVVGDTLSHIRGANAQYEIEDVYLTRS